MKKYILLTLTIFISCVSSNISKEVIINESKKDWQEVEINILYRGNSNKPFYNIFIHHVNIKFKLPSDPFRLIYRLSSTQMESFITQLLENKTTNFEISRLSSWEDVEKIDNINDYIITIKTEKSLFYLKILSKEPRKHLFKNILFLHTGDDYPDINVFLDRITF